MTASAEQLRSGLDGLARTWWRVRWLRRLAVTTGALALLLVLWAATDWWRPLGRLGLLSWGALAAAAVVAAVVWLTRQWSRRPSPVRMALLVEERYPEIDAPISAALDPKAVEGPLGVLVVEQAAAAVDRIDDTRVVDPEERRRGLLVAGAAAVALLVASSVSAPVVSRAARTWQFTIAPPQVVLHVLPGDQRIVRGSPLRIEARLEGVPDGVPYATPRLVVQDDDREAAGEFVPVAGGAYALDLEAVTRDFSYRVEAGGLVSSRYRVEALDRPSVSRIDLAYVYPSFSGLDPREEPDSGDIYAPAGTTVTVKVEATKPLQRAMLVPTEGVAEAPLPLDLVGERGGTVSFEVKADGAYRIALVDRDALDSAGDTEYFVRVMDDRPPDVRILRPAGDRGATRLEEVTIEARAEDDYGVQQLDLVYAVRGGAEKVVPLAGNGRSTAASGRHTLYLEDLDVQPGDFITYYARARDIGRGKRSTEARSDIFFLEVRPTAQEFMAAQASGGMNMAGGDADDLIAAQKDVVVATWKLERRSTGGRSASDIRAVADAQDAVREKTEAQAAQSGMVSGQQRRRRGPAIEPEPSPLLGAVDAMVRATEQLRALDTATAIPHEMEALNQLLRAQAEIRRRQIQQQQSGGGGGRGRSGNEDLSALFDRELLRQQGSQYEQRSNVESRAEADENPALDKIRELARRQDDLAREQQALARERNQLPAEEVKRRLERLTREQERLRQETRQLSQQLQQEQNASGRQDEGSQQPQQGSEAGEQAQAGQSGSSSGQQGQAEGQQAGRSGGQTDGASASGQRMAEAADEMQAAASGLENASPEEAAARGNRSLQALRDAERALQGTLPEERRRAAGDVQLEAQQLADAQRRLAEGTARIAGGEGAADEQRRRLSGEQGRVAERIAQLERQVRELARSSTDRDDPLAQAAAELARRRLAQRVEEASRSLGNRNEPAAQAGQVAEQQRDAAAVLDRVAAMAGQATGRGTRPGADALSGQLANARDVRDRLRDLESRIEALAQEASARAAASESGDSQRGQPGTARESRSGGQPPSAAGSAQRAPGKGQPGQGSGQGGGEGSAQGQGEGQGRDPLAELQRLQQEYQRELQTARQMLQQGSDGSGANRGGRLATPEGHEFSRSAPGTEAFKQDFARWEALKQDLATAMDRYEAGIAQRLAEREAAERVTAPLKDQVPDRYSESVIRYYQSLSRRPETR